MSLLPVCHAEFDHTFLDLTLHLVLSRIAGLDLGYDEWRIFKQWALEEGDLRVGGEGSPFLPLLRRCRAYCEVRCRSLVFRLCSVLTLSV